MVPSVTPLTMKSISARPSARPSRFWRMRSTARIEGWRSIDYNGLRNLPRFQKMLEPTRVRPESTAGQPAPAQLSADAVAQLVEFARSCKAAARAVSLYPGAHPTIQSTLARLAALTAQLTERGPYRLQVLHDRVLVDGAGMVRVDTAVTELATLLYRHVIGSLTLNAGADAESWRTL